MVQDAYNSRLTSVLFLMAMARLLATSLLVVIAIFSGLFGVVSGTLRNLKLRDGLNNWLNILQVLWRDI